MNRGSTLQEAIERTMDTGLTYGEALENGYKELFTEWTRGYVSHIADLASLSVKEAGGIRRGLYYVDIPSWESTTYCTRLYLKAPENEEDED